MIVGVTNSLRGWKKIYVNWKDFWKHTKESVLSSIKKILSEREAWSWLKKALYSSDGLESTGSQTRLQQVETIHAFCPSISRDEAVLLLPERLQGSTLKRAQQDDGPASSRHETLFAYFSPSIYSLTTPWLWSTDIKWQRQVTEAEQRHCPFAISFFSTQKNCFPIAPTFEKILNKRRRHSGNKYVYLANKELGTRDEYIKLSGLVHFICFFIKCVANITVRLQGLELVIPRFKSQLHQSQATQPQEAWLLSFLNCKIRMVIKSNKSKCAYIPPTLHH